ncbi:MAG: DUF359 domain-containing protein [Promethearchaeota archaeon]
MNYNLRIPPDKKYKFTKPLDLLIAGTRKETLPIVENIFKDFIKSNLRLNFYVVGDIVTKDFLANKFLKSFIKLCIIDEKTQRSKINLDIRSFFDKIVEFKNPKGTIQKEIWSLLEKIINSKKKTLLKITEGEEDLLVLPLVLKLPLDFNIKNFVFYGQPPITDSKFFIPQGIVIVNIDKNIQYRVKEYISLMEKF